MNNKSDLCGRRPHRAGLASRLSVVAAAAALAGVVGFGCASSSEQAVSDSLTAQVGQYSPPPAAIQKPRVGVPPFSVQALGFNAHELDQFAADQMSSLLYQSRRFDVVERAQLEQVLREQDLEGIVASGELAQAGQVRGVQYLVLGKVTNFRIKAENTERGIGLGSGGKLLGRVTDTIGGVSFDKNDIKITSECGVDIRLVDPTTGQVAVAHFGEFKRVDNAGSMGLGLGGAKANSGTEIQIDQDDAGKVLRLALDEALRKMLPDIDAMLVAQNTGSSTASTATVVAPAPEAGAAPEQAAAKKFCGECGTQMVATAKFCPSCGHQAQ